MRGGPEAGQSLGTTHSRERPQGQGRGDTGTKVREGDPRAREMPETSRGIWTLARQGQECVEQMGTPKQSGLHNHRDTRDKEIGRRASAGRDEEPEQRWGDL